MRGRPAFGLTHSGRPGAAAESSATIADIASRLVPQLAPTAAAPLPAARATTSAVVVPIIVRVPRSNENVSTNGRSVPSPHAVDRRAGLDRAEHRLEHEQVGAALGERFGLLGVGVGGLVVRERAERLAQLARRAQRARDEDLGSDGLARELRGAAVELARPPAGRALGEPQARAAERAREHDVGAGLGEALVQRDDPIRVGEHPLLGRDSEREAHVLAGRPGRAVGNQDVAALEAVEKCDTGSGGLHAESPFARHPSRDWHLAVRQVAEASTGRDPQPLSMLDELTLATSQGYQLRKRVMPERCCKRSSSSSTPSPSPPARQSTPTLPRWAFSCTSSQACPASDSG